MTRNWPPRCADLLLAQRCLNGLQREPPASRPRRPFCSTRAPSLPPRSKKAEGRSNQSSVFCCFVTPSLFFLCARLNGFVAFSTTSPRNFPEPKTELAYGNPYELIVAVVLSAQCTDKRVNQVMPALLAQFPTPAHLGAAAAEDIFPFIRSVSYPNNKAKHLAGLGRMLTKDFGGEVPSTIEELQRLPGVGRKTANVVVSVIYNQPAMAVDTHVFRVSHRLGLVPKRLLRRWR